MTMTSPHENVAFEETRTGLFDRAFAGRLPAIRYRRTPDGKTPDSAANARSAASAMLIAFAVFALFDSKGIRHFSRDLPGNAFTDLMVEAADEWHGLMVRLGPARVQPAMRQNFGRIRDFRW